MNVSKDSMWRRIYCFLWNILKPKRSLQIVKSDRLQFFLRGHRAREGEKRERPGTYSAQLHIACCRRRQQRRRETERSWDESGSKATAPETRGEESEICVAWGHCPALLQHWVVTDSGALAPRWTWVRATEASGALWILDAVYSCGQRALWAVFSSTKKTLCRKKIPRHIKLAIYAWSTKCRWNKKLIVQLGSTLRDERFEPN
jgi:hypothetical protein